MKVQDITNITQVKSEIHYIQKYVCNVVFEDTFGKVHDFYIGFSMEHKPFGAPDIHITYVDPPDTEVLLGEHIVKKRLVDMSKSGLLVDTEEVLFDS